MIKNPRLTKGAKKLLTVGLLTASLVSVSPAANAYTTTGTYRGYTASSGASSQYHVYANNIDWSKPVGVVFYLDGDYWYNSQSKVHNPNNSDLVGMANVANQRNLLFVPVISPDKNAGGDGITWWENQDANGRWFREYANWFINAVGANRNNVWTIGYSGGAEFETFELGADNQTSWRDNGGSIMVGGGGTSGMQTTPNSSAKAMSFQWWEGTNDVAGITNPPTWSAYNAGLQGYDNYRANGYWNTSFNKVWGANHYQYNFPSILTQAFDKAGVQKPGFTLAGAIGAKYYNSGGQARYGTPTTNEFSLINNGRAQEFSKNHTIYWTESTNAHPVWFSGGIGAKYKADGYEHRYGFPTTDEAASSGGGAYQRFSQANGRAYTIYWTAPYGAHALYENGAIGALYQNTGRSGGWGYPTNDESAISYGAKQNFYQPSNGAKTAVYWAPNTGAHALVETGGIHNKWLGNGGVSGDGFPLTNETTTDNGGAVVYFRNANGAETGYFWSESTGTHTINSKGAFYWYWKQHGYINQMGFPTVDEYQGSDGKAHITFSNGTSLSWTEKTGVTVD